jgi:ATP dependent DNA ligase domain
MTSDVPDQIPADPREWRPQQVRVGRGKPEIVNPIAEPYWIGRHILAIYRDSVREDEWGTVEAIDELGEDAFASAMRALDQLRRSVLASEAVIDGVLVDQAQDPGMSIEFASAHGRLRTDDLMFVALDLLRLDGQPLFDVPLLERKRLLDGLIQQSVLVRISPWVRPPIHPWFATWRGAGFRGVVVKAANSRYIPGTQSTEWAVLERMPHI